MIPDFLKKLLGKGGDVAEAAPKPGLESLAAPMDNLGITPKPSIASPLPALATNPVDSMAMVTPPAPAIPSLINDPRMAGRTIADEFKMRQSDPNPEVVFREPFGAQKYDYVTHGGTELPQRSWKEALKNIATGAMVGMANGQGIGGAIGGAAAGGIGGAIDPVMGKSLRFNSFQLPQLVQNRDYQNQQALSQAKIGAENAKAQHDSLFHAGDVVLDTRTQRPIWQKPEAPYTLNAGAQRRGADGNIIASNPVTARPPAQPGPHYVRDASGNYVDLNAPENKGKAIQGYDKPAPSSDMTPAQKAQMERQERTDAAKMAMEVEKLKTAANQAFNSNDPEEKKMYTTLLGQHTAAARDLAQTYPDYYNVDIDNNGWANIKATGAGRRDVKNMPVKGGSKTNGRTISTTTAQDLLNR